MTSHNFEIFDSAAHSGFYYAECSCGWRGSESQMRKVCFSEGMTHKEQAPPDATAPPAATPQAVSVGGVRHCGRCHSPNCEKVRRNGHPCRTMADRAIDADAAKRAAGCTCRAQAGQCFACLHGDHSGCYYRDCGAAPQAVWTGWLPCESCGRDHDPARDCGDMPEPCSGGCVACNLGHPENCWKPNAPRASAHPPRSGGDPWAQRDRDAGAWA